MLVLLLLLLLLLIFFIKLRSKLGSKVYQLEPTTSEARQRKSIPLLLASSTSGADVPTMNFVRVERSLIPPWRRQSKSVAARLESPVEPLFLLENCVKLRSFDSERDIAGFNVV